MKYMLLVYSPENAWNPEEWSKCVETSMGICREMAAKGQLLSAAPLLPVATGTTVRVRDGQLFITTGPFAETIEQLGGYYIIDVNNLDDALAIAGRLPPAAKGTVEVRPLFKLDGLPAEKLSPDFTASDASLNKFMFLCFAIEIECLFATAGEEQIRGNGGRHAEPLEMFTESTKCQRVSTSVMSAYEDGGMRERSAT